MVRFIIVRHGLTEFNRLHKFQGQCDIALDERGVAQAEITAEHIVANYQIDAIYASDLSRAADTARAVGHRLGLDVTVYPEFREVDVGKWAYQKVSDALKSDPDLAREQGERPGTFRYPDGETLLEVYERASAKLKDIASEIDGKTALVVSHGGTIRALVTKWLGYDINDINKVTFLPNTSITVVEYEDSKFTLLLVGDNSHLPEDMR